MAFHDFRDPIEYVVEQYFQRKRSAESNSIENIDGNSLDINMRSSDGLPDKPCLMLYNRNGKAYKFIYGGYDILREDPLADVFLWQEETIYDENNRAIAFETTYPDGIIIRESLIKDESGKLKEIKVEVE